MSAGGHYPRTWPTQRAELPEGVLGTESDGGSGEPGGYRHRRSSSRGHREHAEHEHARPDRGRSPATEGLGVRQGEGDSGEGGGLDEERGVSGRGPPERAGDVQRIGGARDAEAEGRPGARERQRRAAETCDDTRGDHRDAGLRRPSRPAPKAGNGERNEPERSERREHGPEGEEEPTARLAPAEHEPGAGERRVEEGEPERDVAEREHRHSQRDRE